MTYRTRSVQIEAFQWTGNASAFNLGGWVFEQKQKSGLDMSALRIRIDEKKETVSFLPAKGAIPIEIESGWWIVLLPTGVIGCLPNDLFHQIYERVAS